MLCLPLALPPAEAAEGLGDALSGPLPFPWADGASGRRSDPTWLENKNSSISPNRIATISPHCYSPALGLTLNCRADSEVAEGISSHRISLQPMKDHRLPRSDASDVSPLSSDELVA